MEANYTIDVAFSFLADDEGIAIALADQLRDRYKCFVYSERQLDLAGKDGLEVFSATFRATARVCVVLHRARWGSTKWTRIEETAIKERAFDGGWDFLVVIAVDESPPPKWLPQTKIWLGFERYGLDAAAAVIDARVQEQGGVSRVEAPEDRAERLARLADAREERDRILGSKRGVVMAREALRGLFSELKRSAEGVSERGGVSVRFIERDKDVAMVQSESGSITFGWSQQYSNTLKYSGLLIREYEGLYVFGGWGHHPEVLDETTAFFTIDDQGHGSWREDGDLRRLYSSRELAEKYLTRVVDRIYRASEGNDSEYGF